MMSVKYYIDGTKKGRAYPHYWEKCVGSCHAATLLREDVRHQIRKAHEEIGFEYIRFHGLLDDDMSVVIQQMMPFDKPQISFFNIDCIFDFLLETGMKPFIELGFMPEALASGKTTCFHYKGNVTMPADDAAWQDLMKQLVQHLLDRYGLEEVQSWFFEVWNEPNLRFFFDGTMEDYFHLYELTARAIKETEPSLRVGGPATSNNMWIPELKNFCEENHVPLDFISTHHYPSDDPLSRAGMNGPGTKGSGMDEETIKKMLELGPEKVKEIMAQMLWGENKNPRDILSRLTKKAKDEAGELPLYYTEWNVGHYDTSYAAAGVTQVFAYNEGLVEGYSYWCISDIFEEKGLHGLPFNNEFGLVNVYGIRKPSYRLFEALHQAGSRRLDVTGDNHRTAEVLALEDETAVTVFAYNHDIEERDIKAEEMEITVKGEYKSIKKAVIDSGHCNPFGVWEAQGKPTYPTKAQLAEIEDASELVYEEVPAEETNEQVFCFNAEAESVTIIRLEK